MRFCRGILFLICLLIAIPCQAQIKLYRYFDKVSLDERGVSYSDKDGNPPVSNPDWNIEEIPENKKEHYMNIHNTQIKQKQQDVENALKDKKNKAKAKLASQGFTQDEIDGIVRN